MLDAVVVSASVPESGFTDPQFAAEGRQDDAGFLGDLAAGGLGEGFAVVQAAAGQLPPVLAGVVWVAGVDEEHALRALNS